MLAMAGQTGEKGGLVVESLYSASRSCASPLLAWKHYVGSIVVGLQQAGLHWERCEIRMVDTVIPEQNNFGIASNRTQLGLESHYNIGIL